MFCRQITAEGSLSTLVWQKEWKSFPQLLLKYSKSNYGLPIDDSLTELTLLHVDRISVFPKLPTHNRKQTKFHAKNQEMWESQEEVSSQRQALEVLNLATLQNDYANPSLDLKNDSTFEGNSTTLSPSKDFTKNQFISFPELLLPKPFTPCNTSNLFHSGCQLISAMGGMMSNAELSATAKTKKTRGPNLDPRKSRTCKGCNQSEDICKGGGQKKGGWKVWCIIHGTRNCTRPCEGHTSSCQMTDHH